MTHDYKTKRPKMGAKRSGGGRRQRLRRAAYAHKTTGARCCDKATYVSQAAAAQAAAAQTTLRGQRMKPYRCEDGGWHLTTNIKGTAHG